MKTATVRMLRNDCAKLLRRVEAGEEVAISRRGRIVARLVPAVPGKQRVDWSASAALSVTRTDLPLTVAVSVRLLAEAQGKW